MRIRWSCGDIRREPRTLYGALREAGEFEAFFEALAIVKRQQTAGASIYALWERLEHFRALESPDATREEIEELAAVTALSDAANEFDGAPAEFPRSFREGELDRDDWLPSAPPPADAVALLTVHQAKGLEWDAVFVCNLVEGRFPALARSQYALFDRATFGDAPIDEAARARRALEEERRLFYVAMTRARTQLMLTATEEAREESGRSLSRFYLEAQPFLGESRERSEPVSSAEALAALRRAGGGPAGWRDHVETTNANAMLPSGGLRTSASRLAPVRELRAPVLLREPGRDRRHPHDLDAARRRLPRRARSLPRSRAEGATDARAAARTRRGSSRSRT